MYELLGYFFNGALCLVGRRIFLVSVLGMLYSPRSNIGHFCEIASKHGF